MLLIDIKKTLDNIIEDNDLDSAKFSLGENGLLELILIKGNKTRIITYDHQYLDQLLKDNEEDLFKFMKYNKEFWE